MERLVWRYAIEQDVESTRQCLSPEDFKKFERFYYHVHDALGDFSKRVCSDVYTYFRAEDLLNEPDEHRAYVMHCINEDVKESVVRPFYHRVYDEMLKTEAHDVNGYETILTFAKENVSNITLLEKLTNIKWSDYDEK